MHSRPQLPYQAPEPGRQLVGVEAVEQVLHAQAQVGVALDHQAPAEEQGIRVFLAAGQQQEIAPGAADAHIHGLALRPRLELGSNEAVKQAVAGGLGLSLLSAHALAHAVDEGIAVLRVDGTPLPTQWQVVYPAGKRLSPLASAFLEFLRERAAELERGAQARLDAARR